MLEVKKEKSKPVKKKKCGRKRKIFNAQERALEKLDAEGLFDTAPADVGRDSHASSLRRTSRKGGGGLRRAGRTSLTADGPVA